MKLFTNWFSPFARKVALTLDYKGLDYEAIDGLAHKNNKALWASNPRGEVPALVDGETTIVNSADIVSYLDHAYPARPVYPAEAKTRAKARALERLFDTHVDAIIVDCSLWFWSQRSDEPPQGLLEAGRKDLAVVFSQLEENLSATDTTYFFGDKPGLVEFTLWPHVSALRPLGFVIDEALYPKTLAWFKHLRREPLFQNDAKRTRDFMEGFKPDTHELSKIFWRGDRIEWMLSRGFHQWFMKEIEEDRILWPG